MEMDGLFRSVDAPWRARFKDELLASFNASLDDEDYEVPSSALGRIGSLKAPLSSVQWWA